MRVFLFAPFFAPLQTHSIRPTENLDSYLSDVLLSPTPVHANPSDHAIDLVNTEFLQNAANSTETGGERVERMARSWIQFSGEDANKSEVQEDEAPEQEKKQSSLTGGMGIVEMGKKTRVLVERNFVNYRRNVFAFGIRLALPFFRFIARTDQNHCV